MKKFFAVAFALGALLSGTAAKAEQTLMMSSWLPPQHHVVAYMMVPWIETVERESGGNLKIQILPAALGPPPSAFDLAKDGVADITYGVHGYQPGRFKLTAATEMPFLGDSAEDVSVAYWRIYKKHLEQVNEHEGAHVLGIFSHGPGAIHNNVRTINSIEDMQGLKFRVGGGVAGNVAKSLGVTAMLASATKNFEMLSSGVADGTFLPTEGIKSFKLTKLLSHATILPGGLYNTSFFLVMNPDKYDGLTQANKDALGRASGENFARIAGQGWDRADAEGITAMKADGIEIIAASAAFVEQIKGATAHIESSWIETANGLGVDGAQVMADMRAEITSLANQ